MHVQPACDSFILGVDQFQHLNRVAGGRTFLLAGRRILEIIGFTVPKHGAVCFHIHGLNYSLVPSQNIRDLWTSISGVLVEKLVASRL